MAGWVKLYRKWLESPLAQDANANLVFMHLLINARREPKVDKRYGYTVGVGEWDVTLKQLSSMTGLTEGETRYAVERLVKYGTIETQQTSSRTCGILKLCNYAAYQSGDVDQQQPQQQTNNTPTTDQLHSYKNEKKGEKEKKQEPDGFAVWYASYPRKVGRPRAVKAFTKLSEPDRELCLKSVKAYADAMAGRDPNYIPHPATYLNDRRFDDPPPTPIPQAKPNQRPQFTPSSRLDIY